jgi:hypothetical protein
MDIAVTPEQNQIIASRHPCYNDCLNKWGIFRDVYAGGEEFKKKYIKKFSDREDNHDYQRRVDIAYIPAFAKSNLNVIKNTISQRIWEVTRKNGPESYTTAMNGDKWGVDLLGNSMNSFINKNILPDLLAISKIGVFIDSPQLSANPSMYETLNKRPYLYCYKAEDILSWTPDESAEPNQFSALFLRDTVLDVSQLTGLPTVFKSIYRHLRKVDNKIEVRFYAANGTPCNKFGKSLENETTYTINLPIIPFVVFEISQSLLEDVYSYQIALLNLGSTDMNYGLGANFPFYTEQYDQKTDFTPLKQNAPRTTPVDGAVVNNSKDRTRAPNMDLGIKTGRRYPLGADRPAWVHPSPEPLEISMKKQDQLKLEIKELLNVTLANIMAGSVELQSQDRRQNLESGLNNIGLELHHGELLIAKIWGMYENDTTNVVIQYPKNYNLKTEKERRLEAKELNELKTSVPSLDFQKEVAKEIATVMMQGKVEQGKLDAMFAQVDAASTITSEIEIISKAVELGLVDDETASLALGFPKGTVEKAKKDHAERIARIQLAQGGSDNASARGVNDFAAGKGGSKLEKQQSKLRPDGVPIDNTRGPNAH